MRCSAVLLFGGAISATGVGCGTCETYAAILESVDSATCLDLEAGGDCLPICEELNPGVEFRSCELEKHSACESAGIDCYTTELACK